MDILENTTLAIALGSAIVALIGAEKFKSEFAGLVAGFATFAIITGLRWVLLPASA